MNSRLSITVHIFSPLASTPAQRLTSTFTAVSIGTNGVMIRRQLALLRRAKLVDSKGAKGGGWRLARQPAEISLKDVQLALGKTRIHDAQEHSSSCLLGGKERPQCPRGYLLGN